MKIITTDDKNTSLNLDVIVSIFDWSFKNYKRGHGKRIAGMIGTLLMLEQMGKENFKKLFFSFVSKRHTYRILQKANNFIKNENN